MLLLMMTVTPSWTLSLTACFVLLSFFSPFIDNLDKDYKRYVCSVILLLVLTVFVCSTRRFLYHVANAFNYQSFNLLVLFHYQEYEG